MRLSESHLAVVGLGLMGGSLALALRGKCSRVTGVVRRTETASCAVRSGVVEQATCELAEGVAGADVVVLATPVRHIAGIIPLVGEAMRPGALLVDLGSTKRQVVQAMNRLPEGRLAIGGHPMCGKEKGGLESADPALFEGEVFVLTPTERTTDEALELATELVRAVGARPLLLDAQAHDRAVAVISHLPYLLAASLVLAEEQASMQDPVTSLLAAGGFRGTTRLAASPTEMMRDILLTNRDDVRNALDLFESNLAHARRLLDDPASLEEWMKQAQSRRKEIFK